MKLIRSTHVTFEACFEEYPSGPAIIPANLDRYPSVVIRDPSGQIVEEGVATRVSDRNYSFEWFVPLDAELTTREQLRTWQAEWNIITLSGQQLRQVTDFDVIDKISVPVEEREWTQIALLGSSERLVVRFERDQLDISLVLVRSVGGNPIFTATEIGGEDEPQKIHKVIDEGQVAYWVDTPALTGTGQYIAIWTTRERKLSRVFHTMQYLRVPEPIFWGVLPELRIFIDKVHKKVGLPQAYTDSDCYEYLNKGIDILNRYTPPTSWVIGSFPFQAYGLQFFWVEAAALWGLGAQYLSEVELGFDFSGQTVQLQYDHTAGYAEMISRLQDDLNENVPKIKTYIRRKSGAGSIGVRPMPGEIGLESRVIPIGGGAGGYSSTLDNLVRLGLI